MATFNIQLPNVRQLDWNDKRTQNMLLDFFNELTEKLNYTLNNMDLTNFDRQTYTNLSNAVTLGNIENIVESVKESSAIEDEEELFNRLKYLILDKATELTTEYTKLFETNEEKLQSLYAYTLYAEGETGTISEKWSTDIKQTAEQVQIIAEQQSSLQTDIEGLTELKNDVNATFTFTTNGLVTGRNGSNFSTVLSDAKLAFKQGATEVASISGGQLIIENAAIDNMTASDANIESLSIGRGSYLYEWFLDSNNSLSFRKKS